MEQREALMQYRLLELLCCPMCKGDLTVEVFQHGKREPPAWEKEKRCHERCGFVELGLSKEPDCMTCGLVEITEGLVSCNKCGKGYPIINGVLRFLPDELHQELVERYPEF